MRLVENLGTKLVPSGKYRKKFGLYECTSCKSIGEYRTETIVQRNQELCNSCASKLKNVKHGMRYSSLNATINNIIQRCENPKTDFYYMYGAVGISVCSEWRTDRAAFFEWALSSGWEEGLTIDRIDGKKGYSPENCRWATDKEQANNTSKNIKSRYSVEDLDTIKLDYSEHGLSKRAIQRKYNLPEPTIRKIIDGYYDE